MAVMLLVGVTAASCGGDDTDTPTVNDPAVSLSVGTVTDTTVGFTVTPSNADIVRYGCYEKVEGFVAPDYAEVLAEGVEVNAKAASTQTVENLKPGTTYVVVAAASGNGKVAGHSIEMTTASEPVTVAVAVVIREVDSSSVSFFVTPTDAVDLHWAVYEIGTEAPTVEDVLANDNALPVDEGSLVKAEGLKSATTYIVMAVATDGKNAVYRTTSATTEEESIIFTAATKLVDVSAENNPVVRFTNDRYTFDVDFYHEQSDFLTAGEYMFDVSTYYIGTFSGKSVLKTADGTELGLYSGSIFVGIVEKSYHIAFEIELDDESAFTAVYEGAIENMEIIEKEPEDPTKKIFDTAVYGGTTDLDSTIIDFATADGSKSFKFCFFPYEGYEGTYTMSLDYTSGVVDYYSSALHSMTSNGAWPIVTPENNVVISKVGDNWKVVFNLVAMDDGSTVVGTYEGPIDNLPIGGGEDDSTFTTANIIDKTGGVYTLEMYNQSKSNHIVVGFSYVDESAYTYTDLDGSLVLSQTKNFGALATNALGDVANAGQMTLEKVGDQWSVDLYLEFNGYSIITSYEGAIGGFESDGQKNVVEVTFDSGLTYDGFDENSGSLVDEFVGMYRIELVHGNDDVWIAYYPQVDGDGNVNIAGSYSTADNTVLLSVQDYGDYTHWAFSVPSDVKMTIAANADGTYTLDFEMTVGDTIYKGHCPALRLGDNSSPA